MGKPVLLTHYYPYFRIKSEARRNTMRQKKPETASLKQRSVSLLLALAVVLSSLTFGAVTVASAAETLYFDTSQNTAWNPGSGEKLYATFTDSGGNKVDSTVELTAAGTNLYSVTAPSGAANIQLYLLRSGYTMPDTVPGNGKTRVFLKNNANWNPPYAYAWTNGGEMTWPGAEMTKVSSGSTYWYYYDTPYQNVIFGNGTGTSSPQQSADLNISGKNLIFSKYNGNSGWDSAPYYKKYAEMSLGSRPSGANEMYALAGDEVKFSKYPYSSRTFTPKTIYLFNPDWTTASNVKVTWDLDDPYRGTFSMSPATDYGAGYYTAEVPYDAVIQFSYNYAASNQTAVPAESSSNCFNMRNGANVWCNVADTLREVTDYLAPVEGNAHNSNSAFWVDAVYYDYYSDRELEYGWLNPLKAGTGFNKSSNDWFEFKNFNSHINSLASANSSIWRFPLYFGNLCGTSKAFDGNDAHDDYKGPNFWSNKGYMGPNISGLTNFDYAVNDSNGLWANGQDSTKSPDYHYSVRGLAYNSLDSDGSMQYADGYKMPYFDSSWISSQGLGKTVTSSFPFRQTPLGNGVTGYSFDSANATDNVFFNWNGTTPTSVGYGQGESYGIRDGIQYFMNPDEKDKDTGTYYKNNKYYGIFPFNSTSGNGGNNNLDYGFGIKMEMDFRVPENGILPNGDDCTFSYSGDDDLWVYLSEYDDEGNLTDSQLVLDLGGNHKKAVGSINFATMKATATKSMKPTETGLSRDYVYIVDSYNWGDNLWVWAWNSDSDGKWYKAQYDSSAGCYRVGAGWGPQGDPNGDRFDSKTKFLVCNGKENWGSQTAQDTIVSHMGRMTYTNNLMYCADKAVSYSYNSTYESDFGFESNGSGGYSNLDSSKTYHMSVFYMERGMLESNCKIEFTMTPAQNDVKVHKEIETADVNSGLQSDLQTNDFEFKNAENGAVNNTARYTLNSDEKYSVANNGTYYLSHQDTADFDNQYKTGSNLTVTETKPSDGISYGKTYWEVVNLADGERLAYATDEGHPHTDTSTRAFKLENTNKNSYVTRQVNFVNTPDVTDMTISKTIVDKTGGDLYDVSDDFAFKLLVDLNDGQGYKARKLTYTVSSDGEDIELTTDASGAFRFSSTDSVTFTGMPVGAKYLLKELFASGYKPYQITVGDSTHDYSGGEYYGEFGNGDVSVSVANMQQLISTSLETEKMIEMGTSTALYSNGDLFTFRAQGLDETVYNSSGDKTVDIHTMKKDINQTDIDGKVTFDNDSQFLKFTKAGVYALKIFELKQNDSLTGTDDAYYEDDFTGLDSDQFIALITVDDDPLNPGAFTVSDPVYYYYDGKAPIGASTFTDANKVDIPTFINPVQKGKVTVTKADNRPEVTDRNKLENVSFMLYKVDNTEPAVGEDLKLINPHDEIEVFTDENGVAEFSDLDIYKTTGEGAELKIDGRPQYQMYALREIDTLDQHTRSRVVQIFSLPIEDKDGTPHYEINFDYVNGVIKAPETAGPGSTPFIVVGLIVVFFACASLMAYVLYFRKKGYAFAFRGKRNKK